MEAKVNPEIVEIAIYNGYMQRVENGNYTFTEKGFELAKDFFDTQSAKSAGLSIRREVDVISVVYLLVEALIRQGYVEDER